MCIISFSYNTHRNYPLIIAANRDEFYGRAALPLHQWEDKPVAAGRDVTQGGTWMGVGPNKRFVAITNYRDPKLAEVGTYSRGKIAVDFLEGTQTSQSFAEQLQKDRALYGPFNVLLFDGSMLVHYNNIYDAVTIVAPGVHGLSNDTLNSPWPKVQALTKEVAAITAQQHIDEEALFCALRHDKKAPDELLPSTGVPLALERDLSSIFIDIDGYGTRCSTVILFDGETYQLRERTFEHGQITSEKQLKVE